MKNPPVPPLLGGQEGDFLCRLLLDPFPAAGKGVPPRLHSLLELPISLVILSPAEGQYEAEGHDS